MERRVGGGGDGGGGQRPRSCGEERVVCQDLLWLRLACSLPLPAAAGARFLLAERRAMWRGAAEAVFCLDSCLC